MPALAQLAGVTKRYGATCAISDLDLQIGEGQLLALLGANGAGKSTVVSLLLGLITADQGEVLLFGAAPSRIEARRHIGVMLQEANLPGPLRVKELIELVSSYYPNPRPLNETAALASVEKLLTKTYQSLSGGERRKVQFAIAICGRGQLLFLDEPTVGLDIEARESLWATLRQLVSEGASVLLTTHYLEEAERLADTITFLHQGKIAASGTIDSVRALATLQHVRCITSLTADEIRQWPSVEHVESERGRLSVSTRDAEGTVQRLFSHDSAIRELEVRTAGLDQVFKQLVKERAGE